MLWLLAAVIFPLSAAVSTSAQSPRNSLNIDVPFRLRAPWWNRDHTQVEDEVLLTGTLHISARLWAANPNHIDRIIFHVNAVDIHGTSDTTGQRYRLHGTYALDLRNPDIEVEPDGRFLLPLDGLRLTLRKVDPEPALLSYELDFSSGSTAAVWSTAVNPPVYQCTRLTMPNGSPSPDVWCGSFMWTLSLAPVVYADRVFASGGPACVTSPCEVPNGAVLFNGFAGDYMSPLYMRAHVYGNAAEWWNVHFRWHCKTGNREAPVFTAAGGEAMTCSPLYSATGEPILVYAEITYQRIGSIAPPTGSGSTGWSAYVVSSQPHVFSMLPRPSGSPPPDQMSWWGADGNTNDAAGPNSGTLVGNVTFVPGRAGSAFHFDGAGTVEAPASATLEPQRLTVMLWMRAPFAQPATYLLSKGASACNSDSSYALYTAGDLFFYVSGGGPGTYSPSPPATTDVWDGAWHHIAGTYDGATVRLFVDGVEQGSGSPANSAINYALADNNVFRIGGYRSSCVDFLFTGDIDEVQLFDRALTASEIAAIYTGTP